MQEPHKPHWLRPFLNPAAVIFVICLINVLVTVVRMRQLYLERQLTGFLLSQGYPTAMMVEPFLLLAASVALLINRWWSVVLALLASGRVIYSLGYLSWTAVHFSQDVPMFSRQAMEGMWYLIYQPRPHYLFEVAVGVVIFPYAVLLSLLFVYPRSARQLHGG